MKHLALVALVAVGCKGGEQPPTRPPTPAPPAADLSELMTALCLMTVTPPGPGTGHSGVAVIETRDHRRSPWVIRSYQHMTIDELEAGLRWLATPDQLDGMFPTELCKLGGRPAYGTFLLYNPGEPRTWVLSGRIGKLVKAEVDDRLDAPSRRRGIELVVEALKADGGAAPQLAWYPLDKDTRTTGLAGAWLDAFRAVAPEAR